MRFVFAATLFALLASTAAAQSTGSSFGGSDWSSSSSSSSSDTPSGSGWSASSDSSGGGSGGSAPDLVGLALLGGALLVIFVALPLRDHLRNQVTIRQVSIGVGPARRAKLQEDLRAVLSACDPSKPLGRTLALRQARRALAVADDAWTYEACPPRTRLSRAAAQKRFEAIAKDLRSRFRHETSRRAGYAPRREGPNVSARAAEGVGFCVVSVLVAYRRKDGRREPKQWDLVETLRQIANLDAETLIAVEVIWSPSSESDRMSSAELETIYPELVRRPGANVGNTKCESCRAMYARELGKCPTCGAPT